MSRHMARFQTLVILDGILEVAVVHGLVGLLIELVHAGFCLVVLAPEAAAQAAGEQCGQRHHHDDALKGWPAGAVQVHGEDFVFRAVAGRAESIA